MIIRRVIQPSLYAISTRSATIAAATATKLTGSIVTSLLPSTLLSSSLLLKRTLITCMSCKIPASHLHSANTDGFFATPSLSFYQRRGIKVSGSEVRVGNVVQRKGRTYQVIKAQHTQQGRGGASIQVELRDVDSGNKVTERFRTDEAIERVYVEAKPLKYLYSEGDIVVLTDPETFDQLEVAKELFGKAAAYLKDDMDVSVQYFDGRPMSASVPTRVTCKVVEAQAPMKGLSVNAQYKKVLLDNGLTVLAPPFIVEGHEIVVNTEDDSYMTRAK